MAITGIPDSRTCRPAPPCALPFPSHFPPLGSLRSPSSTSVLREEDQMSIAFILVLLAFISFCLATVQVPARVSWLALGLALWSLAVLLATAPAGKAPLGP